MADSSLITIAIIVVLLFAVTVQAQSFSTDVVQGFASSETVPVIVKLRESYDDSEVQASDLIENVTHVFSSVRGFSADITYNEFNQLLANPNVESIGFDMPVTIALQDSLPIVNATSTWSFTVNGSPITGGGQTVCVLDTGINYTHPDLGNCTTSNFTSGNCSKVIGGYDFVNNDNDPYDDNGHGTHVAGIVAANGLIRGVAPNASIVAMKVLNSGGSGSLSGIAAAIEWCTNNATQFNISVISMSLGTSPFVGYCDSYDSAFTEIVNNAVARNISVVAATGNNGDSTGIGLPACIANVTAVGSTTKSDNISGFSNTNNITDLLAPGSSINSTYISGGYLTLSGTSMATPHVSGAIALLRQYKKIESSIVLAPFQAENALRSTGKNITVAANNLTFPRINVLSALLYLDSSPPVITFVVPTPSNNSNFTAGANITINVTSNEAMVNASLEWDNGTVANITMANSSSTSWFAIQSNLSNGVYFYRVYGRDAAGNLGVTARRRVVIDSFPPMLNVTSPANGSVFTNTNISLNYTVSDDSLVDTCLFVNSTGNTSVLAGCANTTFTGLRGLQNITVIVNDTVGKTNSSIVFFTVNLPPVLSLQRPENITYTTNVSLPLNYTVYDEDLSSIWYRIDSGPNATLTGNTTFNSTDGSHVLVIFANDSLGQIVNASASFSIDSTGPNVTFASPTPANQSVVNITNSVTINVTTNENATTAVLEFDGSNETMNGSATNWYKAKQNLSEGNHTFRVYASDIFNNAGVSDTRSFVVNTSRDMATFINLTNETNRVRNFTTRLLRGTVPVAPTNVSILHNYTLEFNSSRVLVRIREFSWLDANTSAAINLTSNLTTVNISTSFNNSGGLLNESVWVDMNGFLTGNFTPHVTFAGIFRIFFLLNGSRDDPGTTRITSACDENITNRPCFFIGSENSTIYLLTFSGVAAGVDVQPPAVNVTAPANGAVYSSTSVSINFSVSDNIAVDSCFYSLNGAANVTLANCANATITASSGFNNLKIFMNDTTGNVNYTDVNFTVTLPAPPAPSISSSSTSSAWSGTPSSFSASSSSSKMTQTWNVMHVSVPAKMEISSTKIAFRKVLIFVNDTRYDVDVTVDSGTEPNASKPSGKMYQYLHVTEKGLDDATIMRANVEFEVNASWLLSHQISSDRISIFRLNESSGVWNSWLAQKISENSTSIKYNVSLPRLSWFAIGESRPEVANETAKVICAQIITSATMGTECVEYPTPCDVPSGWLVVSSCPLPQVQPVPEKQQTNETSDSSGEPEKAPIVTAPAAKSNETAVIRSPPTVELPRNEIIFGALLTIVVAYISVSLLRQKHSKKSSKRRRHRGSYRRRRQ